MADARKIPDDLKLFDASQGPRKLSADEGEFTNSAASILGS